MTTLNVQDLKPWQKWAGGITGTLVLGALGSGLWDKLGDPVYSIARDAILNLATLGIANLKDVTYKQVALGLHEHASVQTFLLLTVFVNFVFAATIVTMGTRRGYFQYKFPPLSGENADDYQARRLKKVRYDFVSSSIILAAVAVFVFFQGVRLSYIHSAVGHFNQLRTIVRPVVETKFLDVTDSRFAQMTTAGEYSAIIEELKAIVIKNNFRLPEFEPW